MVVKKQDPGHGLKFLGKDETGDKITDYARKGKPFFFVIDFPAARGMVLTPKEAAELGILYDIRGRSNDRADRCATGNFTFAAHPVREGKYRQAFEKVMLHLKQGNTYLLNLTFPTPITTSLTLNEIFHAGIAPYRLLMDGWFVVFSPESFVRITGDRIFSFPMKGTIDATLPGAEEQILADRKELFEHNTIVDLIRNDLGMVATNVRVDRFRYVERIQTNCRDLLQVSSAISGDLPSDYRDRLGEILFKLLPAGSVTGAPKKRTVEIIREVETYDRGFYTGIFGFFDGRDLDSAVMIRFIESTPSGMIYKSGGGITALSDIKSEYEELIRKVYVPFV